MNKIEFNLEDSFGFHFNYIVVTMQRLLESKIKEYDITKLQFSILINLYKNNISTQKEITKYTNGDEASITRLVNRLELKGYLNRVQDKKDKRKKQLILTKNGIIIIKELIPYAIEVNNEITKGLDNNESKQLLKLLQKIHKS